MTNHISGQCAPRAVGLLLLAAAAALSACGTPKAALDQANHSTKLMALLEIELTDFRRVQQGAADARLALMKDQKASLADVQASQQLEVAGSKSAGDTLYEPLTAKLLGDADGVAKAYSGAKAKNDAFAKTLSTLLAPLPSTAAPITEAQSKMAEMGVELKAETRFKELRAFVDDIKKNVDLNKKKVKDAQAAAAKVDSAAAAGAQAAGAEAKATPKP